MIDHPNAKTVWPTVRFDTGNMEVVLIIETDLALTPENPDYDAAAFDSLVEAGRDFLTKNPNYDSVRLDRIARPSSDA